VPGRVRSRARCGGQQDVRGIARGRPGAPSGPDRVPHGSRRRQGHQCQRHEQEEREPQSGHAGGQEERQARGGEHHRGQGSGDASSAVGRGACRGAAVVPVMRRGFDRIPIPTPYGAAPSALLGEPRPRPYPHHRVPGEQFSTRGEAPPPASQRTSARPPHAERPGWPHERAVRRAQITDLDRAAAQAGLQVPAGEPRVMDGEVTGGIAPHHHAGPVERMDPTGVGTCGDGQVPPCGQSRPHRPDGSRRGVRRVLRPHVRRGGGVHPRSLAPAADIVPLPCGQTVRRRRPQA